MIDIIARGMIEESNGDISQISEKVNNHTEDSDIHVTVTDKENWNSHPNDVTAEGNPVQMDNLQDGVPFSEIVVSGKNLYDNNIIVGMVAASTGEMVTTTNKYLSTNGYITVQPNQKYVLSNAENTVYDTVVFYDENKKYISAYVYGVGGIPILNGFVTPENCRYVRWRYYMNGETATVNMLTNIQLELGSTPTEYEQPITGRELQVNVCGKNLIPYPYIRTTETINGVSFSDNGDGSITVNGTSTGNIWYNFTNKFILKANCKYTFSTGSPVTAGGNIGNGGYTTYLSLYDSADSSIVKLYIYPNINKDKATFTCTADSRYCCSTIRIESGTAIDNVTFRPQLELGDTATAYEPYHGASYIITPDSNPYVVPNDIRQVDGLNNISVLEGELTVTSVRKNAAIKKIWDKLDELTTAIIVSNGESE